MKKVSQIRDKKLIYVLFIALFAGGVFALFAGQAFAINFQWYVYTPGTETVSYVDFMDTNACGDGSDSIDAYTGAGNINSGNNNCVLFEAVNPTASSTANQVFTVGQASTQASSFRIIDNSTVATITAGNDIRIAIATSTLDMEWNPSCNTPSFGGSASEKVLSTVTFEGPDNSVAVINVSVGFVAGDDLTISGLCFTNFGSAGYKATGGLYIMKDGITDIGSDADDTKSITIKGDIDDAASSAGQVSNKFITSSVSASELFSFQLAPSSENFSITSLVLNLSGIRGIIQSDIQNAKLFIDYGGGAGLGNGSYDVGLDEQVGGDGAVSVSYTTGTITFSTSFQATTTRDYIFVADISSVHPGDELKLKLDSVNTTGATSNGSVVITGSLNRAYHIRVGGMSAGITVGGSITVETTTTTGGILGGGEIIGTEIDFEAPTGNAAVSGWSNTWTNPSYAYTSDGNYAVDPADNGGARDYMNFGFNVPSGNVIDGIEVKLEAAGTGGVIGLEISWDGGISTTTSGTTTPTLTTSDVIYRIGDPSYKWGKSGWISDHFSNANFRLRVIGNTTGEQDIDAIQVRVYHHSEGGGGGGGDELLYKWPLWGTSLLANLFQATSTQISNLLSLLGRYF